MAPLDMNPNELEPYWVPFTPNRAFKKRPRLFAGAKGMHYFKPDGTKVIDATSGLFCVNAGHCREPIVKAIQEMAAKLDYSPAFQYGHPKVFELASRLSLLAPGDLDYAFFSNSGSRGGRHRAQDRARLSQGPRRRRAHALHRPRARLPRHRLRRHLGRRHRRQPQAVRQHADRRRPPASTYDRSKQAFSQGRARVGRAPGRRADPPRQPARCLHDCRRHRRAGGRLHRHPAAAQGLSEEAARDHGPARHPADLRRGHHRLRPARPLLRLRALRRRRPT